MAGHKLFFALRPDAAVAEKMDMLARRLEGEHGLKGTLVTRDQLHVALHFVGSFTSRPLDTINSAWQAATGLDCQQFGVSFDRVASFKGKAGSCPLVLSANRQGNAALKAFRQTLVAALASRGLEVTHSYTPYVRLMRASTLLEEQPAPTFAWTARKFCLMGSTAGRYNVEGEWPLYTTVPSQSAT